MTFSLAVTLRLAELSLWSAILVLHAPEAWRLLRGRPRYYDLLFSITGGTAIVFIAYSVRGLFGIGTATLTDGLHVAVILIGIATLRVIPAYARARHD